MITVRNGQRCLEPPHLPPKSSRVATISACSRTIRTSAPEDPRNHDYAMASSRLCEAASRHNVSDLRGRSLLPESTPRKSSIGSPRYSPLRPWVLTMYTQREKAFALAIAFSSGVVAFVSACFWTFARRPGSARIVIGLAPANVPCGKLKCEGSWRTSDAVGDEPRVRAEHEGSERREVDPTTPREPHRLGWLVRGELDRWLEVEQSAARDATVEVSGGQNLADRSD